jgi:hypothetical protein
MRDLAKRMRRSAAETHLLFYQTKLEQAARDLEFEAAKLDCYRGFTIPPLRRWVG